MTIEIDTELNVEDYSVCKEVTASVSTAEKERRTADK